MRKPRVRLIVIANYFLISNIDDQWNWKAYRYSTSATHFMGTATFGRDSAIRQTLRILEQKPVS